jgi:hypothetical protein
MDFVKREIFYTKMVMKIFSFRILQPNFCRFLLVSLFVYYITSTADFTKPPVSAFGVVSRDSGFAVLYPFPDFS